MILRLVVTFLAFACPALAQILLSSTRSCLGSGSGVATPNLQLQLTDVYSQFDQGQTRPNEYAYGVDLGTVPPLYNQQGAILTGSGDVLRVVMTGSTVDTSEGYSNDTNLVSTLVLESSILTFEVFRNSSALCSSIRTTTGDTGTITNGSAVVTESGCPYGGGDIALGFSIPLTDSYPLTTITTNLVALDPSNPALRLACYDLSFTPYYPDYFAYSLVRYIVIGIISLFLLLYVLARFYASYTSWLDDNEAHIASSLTLKITSASDPSMRQMWGAIWFNAWAGRQVVMSGSLRRYVTAEVRELFATIAWFSLVGTVAVEWPGFAYPVFQQTAWSTLVWNNSLPFTSPAQPINPRAATSLPSAFVSQMDDVNSPLYLDERLPSVLLDLEGSKRGIEKWSRMIGVRHEDLWSVCAFTFFAICAAVIVAHGLFFVFDSLLDTVGPKRKGGRGQRPTREGNVKPPFNRDDTSYSVQKESINENYEGRRSDASLGRYLDSGDYEEENFVDESADYEHRPEDDFPSWRLHLALLQGNLTRILLFFHLPLTIFSVYQFTLRSTSSTSTFSLAIIVFALVCLAWPIYLLWIIHIKPSRELYTSLPLLLSTGVLYNTYAEECCLFPLVTFASGLIVGIVIGAAQSEGTAQTAVILLVEVGSTVCQSLWLPWGDNAAMGPLAFLLSLARIIIAVLLVVLSPTVAISNEAGSWIAYIVFLVQGLVILLLLSILVFKFFELIIRLVGRVPFDESRSGRGGGLFGALRKLDRVRGGKKGGRGGRNPGVANGAARKRAIEDRRRRNRQQRERLSAPSETTVGTRTHMLAHPARPGHISPSSSMSLDTRRYASSGLVDEDGYIMASMGGGAWTGSDSSRRTGYVKPGAYASSNASGGPVLRNAPAAWGEHPVTLVPASATTIPPPSSTTSSGFTRVGGGRATHKNPYDYTKPSSATAAYPPYPPATSDAYGGPASRNSMPGNPRRLSQSAIVEMAGANAISDSPPLSRHGTRPSLQLPSSSALLTNTVSHYSNGRLEDERRDAKTKTRGGFFGRFKKRRGTMSEDDFTDDTDDTDDEGPSRRKWGGLKLGGWKRKSTGVDQDRYAGDDRVAPSREEPPETGEKGFSVVRKPRPRPTPPTAPPAPPSSSEVEHLADSATVPNSPPPRKEEPLDETPQTPTAESSDPLLARTTSRPSLPPGAAPPQSQQPPHVSVEAPSRPTSLRGDSFGYWEDR
ncbi:uncharacterized protein JCM6883_007010 [Sporobolomyces salmoneus]|uniref:uncharacterized protein n=1 Tax=Sporobolomyces salmoneus TaxID=183962 RepID=UPI0031771BDA